MQMMTERITELDELPGGWRIHGKTGTGPLLRSDGTQDPDRSYGGFVGWLTRDSRSYVFARLSVVGQPETGRAGPYTRDTLLRNLPALIESQHSSP